ncbi:hypothetical protein MMC31_004723 [Peltigera leucophlebia]|nr:hypothetical protein [Peltigera leucophlebia]
MSKFGRLRVNHDAQKICQGCREVEGLFSSRRRDSYSPPAIGCQFHNTFLELEDCARKGCCGCRVFRRAFLLRQVSLQDVERLRSDPGQIWAKLEKDILEVRVGDDKIAHAFARVQCLTTNSVGFTNLVPRFSLDEAKDWIKDCHEKHQDCQNLSWSNQNPSRLVHILSDLKRVQLVEAQLMGPVKYTALSYVWGGDRSAQKWSNHNGPFELSKLPATIQHAIKVTKDLEFDYIWIDALCISGSGASTWKQESSKMHEVYGNACVTLCACSSEKSTDGLFHFREAWEFTSEPCRLDQFWLANFDMALDEVRTKTSISLRAWTLQEERLSPRILYLCGQRLYWSCVASQHSELGQQVRNNPPRRRPYEDPKQTKSLRRPQEFLQTRYKGKEKLLHQQWCEMIQDYTRRDIENVGDRFNAISGLAAQYLVPFCSNGKVKREEYLAGLWRQTFAQDLAWSVRSAGSLSKSLRNTAPAPSWSWASLPLRTIIKMQDDFIGTKDFALLEKSGLGQGQADDTLQVTMRGADIKSVRVRGLLRHFVDDVSHWVAWSAIQSTNGKEGRYDLAKYLAESVHSENNINGEIFVYEPHMQPIVGQLDYLFPAEENECMKDLYLRIDRWMKDLYCLKIGEAAMLLLEKAEMTEKEGVLLQEYRRVGISTGFREGFFANGEAELQDLVLIETLPHYLSSPLSTRKTGGQSSSSGNVMG